MPAVPESFRIVVKMKSDWHVGTGSGRPGGVDRLVRRDEDGIPCVPGKTCMGILRDACEQVAAALGDKWAPYVELLFGSEPASNTDGDELDPPRAGAFAMDTARYPESVRAALRGKRRLIDALTFVKPGVKMDPATGLPLDKHLRFEEMARKGAVLHADAGIDFGGIDAGARPCAFALLMAGCAFAERLGGKRRRGAGRCEFRIDGQEPASWIDLLEKDPPELRRSVPEDAEMPTDGRADTDYTLTITTESPVTIMSRTIGNVVQTLDFIPGSCLLPVIARRAGAGYVSESLKSGKLSVSPAYPAADGVEFLPVPFSLFRAKGDENSVRNLAASGESGGAQWKQWRDQYVHLDGAKARSVRVSTSLTTHNTVDDRTQRPGDNGVYTLQSISSRQAFRAHMRADRDDLAGDWGIVTLGAARHSEYGRARIVVTKDQDNTGKSAAIPAGGTFSIWLLSDTLVRDDRLRLAPTIPNLKAALERDLGVILEVKQDDALLTASSRQRRTDSWQTSWALPRPSLTGLQAGTFVVFETKGAIPEAKLSSLEARGIGERTAEGFGRVKFSPAELAEASYTAENATCAAGVSDRRLVESLQEKALRSAVELEAVALPDQESWRRNEIGFTDKQPENTQLGALRMWAMRLRDDEANLEDWRNSVGEWLASRSLNDKNKWPQKARTWIGELLADGDKAWELLGNSIDWNGILLDGGLDKEALKRRLWPVAVKSIVDSAVRAEVRARSEG